VCVYFSFLSNKKYRKIKIYIFVVPFIGILGSFAFTLPATDELVSSGGGK